MESGERCKLRLWRIAVSSPNGVWGGAPAEIEFCTFYPQNLTSSGNDSNDLPDNQPNLKQFKQYRHFMIFVTD